PRRWVRKLAIERADRGYAGAPRSPKRGPLGAPRARRRSAGALLEGAARNRPASRSRPIDHRRGDADLARRSIVAVQAELEPLRRRDHVEAELRPADRLVRADAGD